VANGNGSENTDVFDWEEEAERAVAKLVPLVAPVLLPLPPPMRRSVLARVLIRAAEAPAAPEAPAAAPDEAPAAPEAAWLIPVAKTTLKDDVERFLTEHPGSTAAAVGDAVYPASTRNRSNRARALLHQMAGDGRVMIADRTGGPAQWYVVPREERRGTRLRQGGNVRALRSRAGGG
jgi:hypothetical protein